ncbi:hypothetical protein SCOR_01165 [Sulfidibacter corallicola]|uniref:YD repeat-containing protein n=1 Tax=Sulfidibacter corallicola TaxID=2818388 RepID=A0A8A4TGV1_SULCO|nr:hypothetical protein [Sulfidibacter corallicola]QTD48863.1 hypothetical protein J3U87_25045 [Sulfidibacter corallicola]
MRARHVMFWILVHATAFSGEVVRTEYYGQLPFWESPVQPIKGSMPLSAEEAADRIHVAIGFDRANRVVDIQLRLGSVYKETQPFFGSMYVHGAHTKIEYVDGREIHRFYDRFGNRIEGWGDVWEKIYETDALGRYRLMRFVDKAGAAIENGWGILRYEWDYLPDGSVVETRFDGKGDWVTHRPGFEFKRIRMVFAADGHLTLMQNVDGRNQLTPSASGAAQYRYFYDRQGRFLRWEVYDESGEPALGPTGTAGEDYVFEEGGRTRILFFDREGKPSFHDSGSVQWDWDCDRFGNIRHLRFRGLDGEPVAGRSGWATVAFEWDPTGRWLMGRTYFDVRGRMVNTVDGFAQIRYRRDGYGLLREQSFHDVEGKPVVSAYDRAAIIRYEYDERHRRIRTLKLGLDGKPIASDQGSAEPAK